MTHWSCGTGRGERIRADTPSPSLLIPGRERTELRWSGLEDGLRAFLPTVPPMEEHLEILGILVGGGANQDTREFPNDQTQLGTASAHPIVKPVVNPGL